MQVNARYINSSKSTPSFSAKNLSRIFVCLLEITFRNNFDPSIKIGISARSTVLPVYVVFYCLTEPLWTDRSIKIGISGHFTVLPVYVVFYCLTESLWTDSSVKAGISARELISTRGGKNSQVGNDSSDLPFKILA